ncbi:hypothetical protein Gorai_001451, partial [Gossypium raimondii]|nr:hypothetical protein [Gossypium raimondii]
MNLKLDIKCNLIPSLNLDEGKVLSFRILNLIESSLFSGYCAANRENLSWSRWNKHEIILFLLVFPVFLVLANDTIFCPVTSCCSQESTQQQSYQNNAAIELINSVTGADEEGRSRQRVLVYAARRYASALERNPEDYDALYNWALVLQESADNVSPDSTSPSKDSLLEEACNKYDEATRLCPTFHD